MDSKKLALNEFVKTLKERYKGRIKKNHLIWFLCERRL